MAAADDPLLKNLATFTAFARKRLGDEALAADVVQDSLVKALSAERRPDDGEDSVAWFYRILRRSIIDLYRRNAQAWQQRIHSTRLYPLLHAELLNQLVKAGFEAVTAYGDMEGSAFDARQSGNLVLAARKRAR